MKLEKVEFGENQNYSSIRPSIDTPAFNLIDMVLYDIDEQRVNRTYSNMFHKRINSSLNYFKAIFSWSFIKKEENL